MKKIKSASVAGKFYPDDKELLLSFLEDCAENNREQYKYSSRAIIVPHAGYIYSGQFASEGFQYLNKKAKNIFVIAPSHYVGIDGIAISSCDFWATPLGEIQVNQNINQILADDFGAKFNDKAIEPEHSLEVQIPFIQKFLPEAQIVPSKPS